ncbi:MAG TPA: peptide ABC transporter substrate-binding protein [Candidatus Dormibacteraeota bacterium]
MSFSGNAAKSSIRSRLAALALILAPVLGGCNSLPGGVGGARPAASAPSPSAYRPEAARREGGSLIVGDWESPTDFSPLYNDEAPAREIDSLLFAGLTRRDAQLQPIADLASDVPTLDNGGVTWDRASQRMTVSYQLRAGLRWSDGQPLTTADVEFTWRTIKNSRPGTPLNSDGYGAIASLVVRDARHFALNFDRIYPQYVDLFSAILPQHRLADVPPAGMAASPYFSRPDVVSGPFKIDELVADDHISLVRNNAWSEGRAGRRPHLDSILFRIYPEAGQLIDAARKGQVDLALEISDEQLASLGGTGGSSPQRRPALSYEQVSFNQADPNPQTGVSPPWKGDPVLLQALRSSIDRAAIVQKLFQGQVPVASSPVSSLLHDFHDADPGLRFDAPGAAQALDRDGWVQGGDGIRVKNGRRLSFSLLAALGDPLRTALRAELIAQWRRLGVDVIPKDAHSSAIFSGFAQGGLLEQGKFEAGLWTFSTGADPDSIYPLEHSSQIPTEKNQGVGANFSRVASAEIDRSLDRGRRTLLLGERVQAYAAFERAYARLGAELPLFERVQTVLTSQRLHNLQPNSGAATSLWNAADWWIG